MSTELKPQLRFAGFTDAWELRKLEDFCKITIGEFVIKTKQRNDAPFPVYNGGTSNTGYYDDFNQEGQKIIISARGANAGFVNKENGRYWAGNSCYSVGVDDDSSWLFLYHCIKHIQLEFIKGQQSANIPSVSKEQVQKTLVKLPKPKEQYKIHQILDAMDNLITLHQRKLEKLCNVKKALLEKMFPKAEENTPAIRFKGFTDLWEQRRLGETSPLRGGYAFQSNKFEKEGVPVVKISNILSTGEVGGDFDYYNELPQDDNFVLPEGAAVLAMSGATTGKVSILNNTEKTKIYQNQRVGYFTQNKTVDYAFIKTIVKSNLFINQLKSVLVAGAQPNVSSKDIDNFEFYFSKSVKEQSKIGKLFSNLDNLITLHQRKLEKLCNVKKALLEKMFV